MESAKKCRILMFFKVREDCCKKEETLNAKRMMAPCIDNEVRCKHFASNVMVTVIINPTLC